MELRIENVAIQIVAKKHAVGRLALKQPQGNDYRRKKSNTQAGKLLPIQIILK